MSLPSTDQDIINEQLRYKGLRLKFKDPGLEASYQAEFTKQTVSLKHHSVFVVMAFIGLGIGLSVFIPKPLDIWPFTWGILSIIVITILTCLQFKILDRFFNLYMGVGLYIAVVTTACYPAFTSLLHIKIVGYIGLVIAIVVGYGALGISARVTLLINSLAAISIFLILKIAPFEGWPFFIWYSFLGANGIGIAFSVIQEGAFRYQFLQGRLLDIEKERADKLARFMEQMTRVDKLTGIANRHYFDMVLSDEWTRSLRTEQPISLLFIDIDYFKLFNDNFGHQAGDEAIKQVALIIKAHAVKNGSLCARYGGEEFVLLLPNTDEEDARLLAQMVLASVKDANIKRDDLEKQNQDRVTVSIGCYTQTARIGTDEKELIKLADDALYQAKNSGRNRWVQINSSVN